MMPRSRYSILVFALLCIPGIVLSVQQVFDYVKAHSEGDTVIIEWRVGENTRVREFEIQRKKENGGDFRLIGRMANTNGDCRYTDKGAFYKTSADDRYIYRVKAIGDGFQQYSPSITVTHAVSGVRNSWGMIKELFR